MAVCDITPQEALDDAKCFACLTPYQLMQVTVSLLCKILQEYNPMATCDPNTLIADAKCFDCLLPYQLQLVTVQLLCEIKNTINDSGGGSGTGCVLCGDTDPREAPEDCECAVYYDRATGRLWYWNDTTTAWVLLIGM